MTDYLNANAFKTVQKYIPHALGVVTVGAVGIAGAKSVFGNSTLKAAEAQLKAANDRLDLLAAAKHSSSFISGKAAGWGAVALAATTLVAWAGRSLMHHYNPENTTRNVWESMTKDPKSFFKWLKGKLNNLGKSGKSELRSERTRKSGEFVGTNQEEHERQEVLLDGILTKRKGEVTKEEAKLTELTTAHSDLVEQQKTAIASVNTIHDKLAKLHEALDLRAEATDRKPQASRLKVKVETQNSSNEAYIAFEATKKADITNASNAIREYKTYIEENLPAGVDLKTVLELPNADQYDETFVKEQFRQKITDAKNSKTEQAAVVKRSKQAQKDAQDELNEHKPKLQAAIDKDEESLKKAKEHQAKKNGTN
jgi:hypothetical protein